MKNIEKSVLGFISIKVVFPRLNKLFSALIVFILVFAPIQPLYFLKAKDEGSFTKWENAKERYLAEYADKKIVAPPSKPKKSPVSKKVSSELKNNEILNITEPTNESKVEIVIKDTENIKDMQEITEEDAPATIIEQPVDTPTPYGSGQTGEIPRP